MQQIKNMEKDGALVFYIEDDEKIVILAAGDECKFEDIEKVAAERYLDHLEEQNNKSK